MNNINVLPASRKVDLNTFASSFGLLVGTNFVSVDFLRSSLVFLPISLVTFKEFV